MGTSLDVFNLLESGSLGWMISNGPGDPSAMTDTIALVRDIIALGQPVFGICLGQEFDA